MNLGLGLIAADSAIRESRAQDIRDREAQRFEWEKQRADAEMGLLDDKTASERSRYQLSDAQSKANMETLPGQTANTLAQQGITSTELAGTAARQPTVEATKNVTATMDKNQAESNLMSQADKLTADRNTAKVNAGMSQYAVEDLPRVIANKKLEGTMSDMDAQMTIAAKMSDLIDAGDSNSIVTLLNAQKKYVQDPKIQALPDAASVSKAVDAKGNEFLVVKDAQGNQIMSRPIEAFRSAKAALAKIEYKGVDAGDSLVRVQGGRVTPVYTAPESAKSMAAHQGPMERDVNYLMTTFGMKDTDALAFINQGKTMSKAQFILKAKQDLIAIGDQDKIGPDFEEKMSGMYDRSIEASKPKGSNSSPSPTLKASPAVRSVLGLP